MSLDLAGCIAFLALCAGELLLMREIVKLKRTVADLRRGAAGSGQG
jgi:hypothetical protein